MYYVSSLTIQFFSRTHTHTRKQSIIVKLILNCFMRVRRDVQKSANSGKRLQSAFRLINFVVTMTCSDGDYPRPARWTLRSVVRDKETILETFSLDHDSRLHLPLPHFRIGNITLQDARVNHAVTGVIWRLTSWRTLFSEEELLVQ